MILKYLDRAIDKHTFTLFSKLRKVGRRAEHTFNTTYRDWLLYASRRSKDKNVKITLVTVTYLTFVVFRTFTYFMTLTPAMQQDSTYSGFLIKLDTYNQHGTIYPEIQESKFEITEELGKRMIEITLEQAFN